MEPKVGTLFIAPAQLLANSTIVPKDAGQPRVIPSVPRPDQKDTETAGGLGASELDLAADDATATTGFSEVVTAVGGELPPDIGQKYSRSGGKERGKKPAQHGGRNQPSHG